MTRRQRVAVVGAGISGLVAAFLLHRHYDVTLFEAQKRAGGHTHTHTIDLAGRQYEVDTGFIVFNHHNYPLFSALLDELDVASHATEMSFSASNAQTGVEYAATSFDTLFCQRRNLLRPAFWKMLSDIRRFYRQAPAYLNSDGPGPAIGAYLNAEGYSKAFISDHLLPMASALWSAPARQVLEFPLRYMLQFFANHHMLQFTGRPQWRVVSGGSSRYVEALLKQYSGTVSLGCPVQSITRNADSVQLQTPQGAWQGDAVVLACHSDQALQLIADATPQEHDLLGKIGYQSNQVVLHTDASLLPNNCKAWASWNAHVAPAEDKTCTVTYNMNILQGIQAPETFCVTLNQNAAIDEAKILQRMTYEHPIYTHAAVAAQQQIAGLQGRRRTFFCGAWQGWGFHEDGVASAHRAVAALRESELA